MYNICISIICVQFLRGTGHLVEKEKTSHYVWGGHTDYCWKSTRVRGAGAYSRSDTGVSVAPIDLQDKHLLDTAFSL